MTELVELSVTKHADLKLKQHVEMAFASKQHLLKITLQEIPQMAAQLPVVMTRHYSSGQLYVLVMTSFEPHRNVVISNNHWLGFSMPASVESYPFYLMASNNQAGYSIGIDETSDDFSTTEGEPLFNGSKATDLLAKKTALLEQEIVQDAQTSDFLTTLDNLNLLKPFDVIVHYESGTKKTIPGLITINEQQLNALSAEQLHQLHQQHYLPAIYGLLISLTQFNGLIKYHNAQSENKIVHCELEVAKARDLL
jgi:hypothetical protein